MRRMVLPRIMSSTILCPWSGRKGISCHVPPALCLSALLLLQHRQHDWIHIDIATQVVWLSKSASSRSQARLRCWGHLFGHIPQMYEMGPWSKTLWPFPPPWHDSWLMTKGPWLRKGWNALTIYIYRQVPSNAESFWFKHVKLSDPPVWRGLVANPLPFGTSSKQGLRQSRLGTANQLGKADILKNRHPEAEWVVVGGKPRCCDQKGFQRCYSIVPYGLQTLPLLLT